MMMMTMMIKLALVALATPAAAQSCTINNVITPEPDGTLFTFDFATAMVSADGVVTDTIETTQSSVNITVVATDLFEKPALANIYDAAAATGVDPDLDTSPEEGNVIIVQEEGVDMSTPDDEANGGILLVSFETEEGTTLSLRGVTVLDVEKVATVSAEGPSGTGIAQIDLGPVEDGGKVSGDIEVDQVEEMSVIFAESGAIGSITLCVAHAGQEREVDGDPHVHTEDGHLVNIYLPVGKWVPMMTGEKYAIMGHVFSKADDKTLQWFDGVAVVGVENNGETIFNVTLPHDVPVGEVGARDAISYVRAELDGARIVDTNKNYVSRDGGVEIKAAKLNEAIRGGHKPIFNDKLRVTTSDFSFSLNNARETNRGMYTSLEDQLSLTHIDFHVGKIENFDALTGPLAELMYRDHYNISSAADAWTHKDNAYATTAMM